MTWLWVFLGGGLGSMLRYAISKLAIATFGTSPNFPLATLFSNILASGLLAFLLLQSPGRLSEAQRSFWAIGFCGGFSTFSTFSLENWVLIDQKAWLYLFLNMILSLGLGLVVMLIASRNGLNG